MSFYLQVDTSDNDKVKGFAPYAPADRHLLNDPGNNLVVRPDSDVACAGTPPADLIVLVPGQDPVYNYRWNGTGLEAI